MNKFLNNIRTCDSKIQFKKKIINTILILLLGIVLGIISKWLDDFRDDGGLVWHILNGTLALKDIFSEFGIWLLIAIAISVYSKSPLRAGINVFLFFLGMTISYHLYTIYISGFNPSRYMMIWYTITLFSPILAFICWYAKGNSKISLIISSLILCVMFIVSFSIGMWYFDLKSIIDLLIFIMTVYVLYMNPKNTLFSLIISLILAYVVRMFI